MDCDDIHGPQRIDPNDFGDPLSLDFIKITQQPLDGLPFKVAQTFIVSRGWIVIHLIPWPEFQFDRYFSL